MRRRVIRLPRVVRGSRCYSILKILLLCYKSYRLALSGAADQDDVNNWIALGRGALVEAEKLAQLRSELTDLSVADRQKLQAAIALIKSVLRLLSEHRVAVVGAGLQANENGLQKRVKMAPR